MKNLRTTLTFPLLAASFVSYPAGEHIQRGGGAVPALAAEQADTITASRNEWSARWGQLTGDSSRLNYGLNTDVPLAGLW